MSKLFKKFSTPAYKSLVKNVSKELSDLDLFVKRRTAEGYWRIGKFIHEHLLKHQDRAEYGVALYENLEKDVGRDSKTLQRSVQFYRAYPIVAASRQFTWEHYKSLMTIKDKDERKKIEARVIQKDWKVRDLREYLKSKREAKPPVVKDVSISQLKFTRGRLNVFQIVDVGADLRVRPDDKGEHTGSPLRTNDEQRNSPLRIDLGFRLHHVLPPDAPRVKDGDIVEIVFKNGRASGIQKSSAAKDELFTYQAYIEKIIDGDTLLVTFDFVDFSISQKLRLRGIDCPEMDTLEGKAAKRFVESCLKGLETITVKTSKDRSDKFDRYLADVFYGAEGTYLNQQLLDQGLAGVY